MTDEDILKEQILRHIYYSPSEGFRSIDNIYEQAKKELDIQNISISKSFVKDWLRKQETYTRFKHFKGVRVFRSTFVRDLADQVQVDLIDMQKYRSENNNFGWILMGIEILSRFGFAIPAEYKSGSSIERATSFFLEQFKRKLHKYPKLMQFDEGFYIFIRKLVSLLKS